MVAGKALAESAVQNMSVRFRQRVPFVYWQNVLVFRVEGQVATICNLSTEWVVCLDMCSCPYSSGAHEFLVASIMFASVTCEMHVGTLKEPPYMCIATCKNQLHIDSELGTKRYMTPKSLEPSIALPQVIGSFESKDMHVFHSTCT